eukprot:Skav226786  [mRNA]  locus=scaffold8:348396:349919:- [translate_table: standard]
MKSVAEGHGNLPPTSFGVSSATSAPASPFEPYLCVKTKADSIFGLVVPKELLLEDQPGFLTIRVGPSERTLPIDDVEACDASLGRLEEILRREAKHADLIVEAKRLQRTQGAAPFCGAALLHDQIPANHWGITMASIDDFLAVVTEKWLRGDLHNTSNYSTTKFDDALIGPNMYQVCEQVIKVMTADSSLIMPGVSWALKESLVGEVAMHFVSHAWAEGAFEFHRLLKQAWRNSGFPQDAGAYICFLSNPQNLDIGAMLSTIETSPFHIALQNMSSSDGKVIMLATENAAIHTRLWCVFEAHSAMERGIAIDVTGDPRNLARQRSSLQQEEDQLRKEFHIMCVLSCGLILCSNHRLTRFLSGQGCITVEEDFHHGMAGLTDWFAGNKTRSIFHGCSVQAVVVFGVVYLFQFCAVCFVVVFLFRSHLDWFVKAILFVLGILYGSLFFWLPLRVGRLRSLARKGAFLSVRDAQCSSSEDAEKIRAVIAGKEDEIGATIGTLLFEYMHRH